MSNFTDFIGGGGSASYPTFFLTTSQTWVPPQDGNICIHVVGAGGSGSIGGQSNMQNMRGGGAGGYCKKNSLAVTTSGSFTVVVGAGGAARITNVDSTSVYESGYDGGNSTVSGTGLTSTLTANGGEKGARVTFGGGGTASGGDLNYTGGNGRTYAGGGAVNLTNTGTTHNATVLAQDTGFYAGTPQIQGNFWDSKEGVLMGGKGGIGCRNPTSTNSSMQTLVSDGGFLAGGGNVMCDQANIYMSIYGGAGGLGGGGGAGILRNTKGAAGGLGGDGVVVIQYLPE